MQAAPIVEALDILEHIGPSLIACEVVALLDELAFQRCKEALHRRVVPAVAFAAHRADHPMLPQPLAVTVRRILHPAIGVVDEAWRGAPACDGHVERSQRKLVAEMV